MDYSRFELTDRLAANYVVGLLRGPARRRFEALLPSHPGLRAAVSSWALRLMPLTAFIVPVEPPAHVWAGIEARLPGALAPNAPAASWWQALGLWRGLAGVATAAAVAFAVVLERPVPPQPAQPPVIVVLAAASGASQGQNSFVAGISADGRAIVTRPIVPVALESSRALELWAVPASGAPKSLGLISAKAPSVVQRDRLPAGTAALAVSLEPSGGSTTGAPSGPVLYVGKLAL